VHRRDPAQALFAVVYQPDISLAIFLTRRCGAEPHGFVRVAVQSADNLLSITNQILGFSKIEAGKLLWKASASPSMDY